MTKFPTMFINKLNINCKLTNLDHSMFIYMTHVTIEK
jgi:hypothetical protein